MIRSVQYLTAALVLAATVAAGKHLPRSTKSLHIESLIQRPLRVKVSSGPAGLWLDSAAAAGAQAQLVVMTPAVLTVADSVQWMNVTVLGPGAVRLWFDAAASAPGRAPIIWGRDITLERGRDGQFRPVAKVHPLYP